MSRFNWNFGNPETRAAAGLAIALTLLVMPAPTAFYDGQFLGPHWVAIGKDREVYVADFEGRRVQKFVRDRRQNFRTPKPRTSR